MDEINKKRRQKMILGRESGCSLALDFFAYSKEIGAVIPDVSGKGNDAIILGPVPGNLGWTLDGVDDVFSIADPANNSLDWAGGTTFHCRMWLKMNVLQQCYLIFKYEDAPLTGWGIYMSVAGAVSGRTRNSSWIDTPSFNVSVGEVFCVDFLGDGTNIKIFKNGVQQGVDVAQNRYLRNNSSLVIGGSYSNMNGSIGLVELYVGRFLSQAEITDKFENERLIFGV